MKEERCVLKYADDLVLIAKSEDGLQKCLNSLYSYCAQNKLTVNTSKSKIMHFTKKTNKINERNTVYYGTSSLEWVVEFKYLGIIIAKKILSEEHLIIYASKVKEHKLY